MAATKMDRARVVVLLALAAGSSKRAAAGKAGIAWSTFCRWQQEEEFADAVEVATGQGREVYENLIRQHAEKDWRAAYALYESIYLDNAKGRRGASTDDLMPVEAPDSTLAHLTEEEARSRVAEVMTILRNALGSDEAVQKVVESNARRLRLVE